MYEIRTNFKLFVTDRFYPTAEGAINQARILTRGLGRIHHVYTTASTTGASPRRIWSSTDDEEATEDALTSNT